MTTAEAGSANARLRLSLLESLYEDAAVAVSGRLEAILATATQELGHQPRPSLWDEGDVWLITYADQFQRSGERPLETLRSVLNNELAELCTGVHILPFYPWTSDEGFSVSDYLAVDPDFGTWEDVAAIGQGRHLMVDAVINHASVSCRWFTDFLDGKAPWNRFFRTEDPETDVSLVVRPRTHPLLTQFDTATGPAWVWTTFSNDQVDLDYAEPEVLLAIVEVLLTYVANGATAIRLDAIGFLWKDPTRSSIHLPETHTAIQLMRSCLDEVAPGTVIISETNVPHEENISYFNDDPAEVHAVYQFPLATLSANAALTGKADTLIDWANGMTDVVGPDQSYLNFLASHDGIGVRPAEGLLEPSAIADLVTACEAVGGRVSYRDLGDGTHAPYELNTTWFDLMSYGVDEATAVARHLATHAVMLALPGIPAIYAHSLFGSSNDSAGYAASGANRSLNRKRFEAVDEVFETLQTDGRASRVFEGLRRHVAARRSSPAFHPEGSCVVLPLGGAALAIERSHNGATARCLVNLGPEPVTVDEPARPQLHGNAFTGQLGPYEVAWLAVPS